MTEARGASSPVNAAIAREIRASRVRAGLTQEQVCTATGINPTSYQRYEAGKRPITVDFLLEVAQAIGVAVEDLWRDAARYSPDLFSPPLAEPTPDEIQELGPEHGGKPARSPRRDAIPRV